MNQFFRVAAIAAFAFTAQACATRPPVPSAASTTPFVAERDLVGASVARGEFRAITGVRRGFTAQLNGTWDGVTLTLVEDFAYDDGERDRKTWHLRRTGPGRLLARARMLSAKRKAIRTAMFSASNTM
jgi:hypothetical protein